MILVFGSHGLLGSAICDLEPKDTVGVSRADLDVYPDSHNYDKLLKLMENVRPDAVINCVGIVPRNPRQEHIKFVNSIFPVWLRSACDNVGAKLIQISTDCVFGQNFSNACEDSVPDAEDPYGISKAAGEVVSSPHLTVRTSFVGLPDPPGRGLLAWLKDRAGETINGYREVLWNGLTTFELGRILLDLAYRDVSGLIHVFGETTTKYELLCAVNYICDFGCTIVPVDYPVSTRTLATCREDVGLCTVPALHHQLLEIHKRTF